MTQQTKRIIDTAVVLLLAAAAAANVAFALHGRSRAISARPTETAAPVDTVRRARLVFAGDLMVHTPMLTAARRYGGDSLEYDFRPMFRHVAERFRQADYAVLNLETTIARSRFTGYPMFRSPAAVVDAMRDMGIDAVATANNHCCDGGAAGIDTTVALLDSAGIAHTGTFTDSLDYKRNNPHHFKCRGISFAMLAYTYGTNGLPIPGGRVVNRIDTVAMARDLAMLPRSEVDVRIVFIHWGVEYRQTENPEQRQIADFLRRHGADLIIGSHPHVIQPVQADSTGVTIYSLGNFVSNQQWRRSDGGLMATVDIEKRPGCRPIYRTTLEPVWVMMPGYRLIPPETGDTIRMTEQQRTRYRQFLDDTRLTLGTE